MIITLDDRTIAAVLDYNWPAADGCPKRFASEYRDLDPSLFAAVLAGRLEMGDHVTELMSDMDLMVFRARENIALNRAHGEDSTYNLEGLLCIRKLSKELRRFLS